MNEKSKRNVPTWLKVVIGGVSLFLGLLIGLAIVAAVFCFKANDPAYKKNIALSIADFSDPLPAGFTLGAATDMANVKTVLFNHAPEQMDISISEVDVADEKMKQAFDKSFDEKAAGGEDKPTEGGKVAFAGHMLEYKIGISTIGDIKVATLDGRVDDLPGEFVSIKAFSDGSKPFNMPLFKSLIDSVKSFASKRSHQ